MSDAILRVEDLKTYFDTEDGVVKAVDGVSFELRQGETLGLVGESGCGKSVTAHSIMRLIPSPPGRHAGGKVLLRGDDLMKLSQRRMRRVRGREIGMIFQEPTTSLNPVYRVGWQIAEPMVVVEGERRREAWQRSVDMLGQVRIGSPEERAKAYPHQMSGGMKQRSMIAMALVRNPSILIADEPTTALDVTIQAQILELMKDLQRRFSTASLLITHNMGVVAETAHRVAVMYTGRIVETAATADIFADPLHPYTRGLLACIPSLTGEREKLQAIKGQVPDPAHLPSGCTFRPRCPLAGDICAREYPPLREIKSGHFASCHMI